MDYFSDQGLRCCNPDCNALHGGMSQYCSRSCMRDDVNNWPYWPHVDEPEPTTPYVDELVDTLLPKHKKKKTVTFKDDIAEEITVSRWLPDNKLIRELCKTYTRKQLEQIGVEYNVGKLYKYPTKQDLARAIVPLM